MGLLDRIQEVRDRREAAKQEQDVLVEKDQEFESRLVELESVQADVRGVLENTEGEYGEAMEAINELRSFEEEDLNQVDAADINAIKVTADDTISRFNELRAQLTEVEMEIAGIEAKNVEDAKVKQREEWDVKGSVNFYRNTERWKKYQYSNTEVDEGELEELMENFRVVMQQEDRFVFPGNEGFFALLRGESTRAEALDLYTQKYVPTLEETRDVIKSRHESRRELGGEKAEDYEIEAEALSAFDTDSYHPVLDVVKRLEEVKKVDLSSAEAIDALAKDHIKKFTKAMDDGIQAWMMASMRQEGMNEHDLAKEMLFLNGEVRTGTTMEKVIKLAPEFGGNAVGLAATVRTLAGRHRGDIRLNRHWDRILKEANKAAGY